MVDAIRARFATLLTVESRLGAERRQRADDHGRTAILVAVVAGLATLLLVLAYCAWLDREIVEPVRRLARATRLIADGALETRVHAAGSAEIADLTGNFNAMADALESNRDELEAQNHELETQQVTLETTLE